MTGRCSVWKSAGLVNNAPPTGGHDFQATGTIFELVQDIIGTNPLTKFHDDRTINMASRVLTRKNATPPWPPFFSTNHISGTNLLTKFHDDRTINVASRVLIMKHARPPDGHDFKATETIFELIQNIIRKNLLTKFNDDRKINLVQDIIGMNLLTKKNAPPLGSHVFQANVTILELIQDIMETNLLSKFHEDWTINEKCPAPWRPYIIGINLVSKFHEDWTINVASRVLTGKNAPPLGSHVFQANVTIFELIQDIIDTILLTKFHEDWTLNLASGAITKAHHEHIVLRLGDRRFNLLKINILIISDDGKEEWSCSKTKPGRIHHPLRGCLENDYDEVLRWRQNVYHHEHRISS
ncbi:hypothetical protein DPMN_159582 [Dreissena polymorpha]|uniref:Uncharacterized protein n=1 Tax=Dreissena polymorpha TaxID=45954 RepID=A0A9D4EL90_DREPO|nr:hypothetical protein DPMN_159582 [Dreissena polymorpha]